MSIIRIIKANRPKHPNHKGQTMPNDAPQANPDKDLGQDPGQDTVYTSKSEVSCDGDDGALGHPKVYLHMKNNGENGQVDCPYCDRVFVFQQGAE
jgi:uncharacterized Zn-finger protein